MQRAGYVQFANTLRGLAALAVVISHFYGVFWYRPEAVAALLRTSPIPALGVPIYIQWINFAHPNLDWGSFGVALFFMISGFVIPASLAKTSPMAFLKARVFRILPTYVVGFAFSLAAIWYNVRMSGQTWPPFPVSHILIHLIPGLRDLLGTTNIDGIIWTLEIEVKFYLICALAVPLFRAASPRVFLLPFGIAVTFVVAVLVWHPNPMIFASRLLFASQFIFFMFTGTAFYFAQIGAMTDRKALLIASLIMAIFVGLWAIVRHRLSYLELRCCLPRILVRIYISRSLRQTPHYRVSSRH